MPKINITHQEEINPMITEKLTMSPQSIFTKKNGQQETINNFYKEYKPQNQTQTLPLTNKYGQKISINPNSTFQNSSSRRPDGTPIEMSQNKVAVPATQGNIVRSEKQSREQRIFDQKQQIKSNDQKSHDHKFKNLNEFMQSQYKLLSQQNPQLAKQQIHLNSSDNLTKNAGGQIQEILPNRSMYKDPNQTVQSQLTNQLNVTVGENQSMQNQSNFKDNKFVQNQIKQFINLVDLSNSLEVESRRNIAINRTEKNNSHVNHSYHPKPNDLQYATAQKFFNDQRQQNKSKSQITNQVRAQGDNSQLKNENIQLGHQKNKMDQNMWNHFKNLLQIENNQQNLNKLEKQAILTMQSQLNTLNVIGGGTNSNNHHSGLNSYLEDGLAMKNQNTALNLQGVASQNQRASTIQGQIKTHNNSKNNSSPNTGIRASSFRDTNSIVNRPNQSEINFNNSTQQAARIQQALCDEMLLDQYGSNGGRNSNTQKRQTPQQLKQYSHVENLSMNQQSSTNQSGLNINKELLEVAHNIQRLQYLNSTKKNADKLPPGTKFINPNDQPYKDASKTISHPHGSHVQPTININRLNLNIQQFSNQPLLGGIQGSSFAKHNTFGQDGFGGMPMSIKSTMFIMDCQTIGLLSNQKLLNMEQHKQMPFSNDFKEPALTEQQMITFIQSRAETCSTTLFKEMPKLSEDAKRIINTIKAQQHLNVLDEIPKLNTLIIEIDYLDYKNQLLQALFNIYGDKVLENLVHTIDLNFQDNQQIYINFRERNFQTIIEYMEKIRQHHSESVSHQSSDVAGNRSPRGARQNEKATNKDEGLTAELDLLFPKNHVLSNNVNSSASLEKLKNSGNDGKNISKGSKRVNSIMLKTDNKKLRKKVNFHVIVKNTKLYRAVLFSDKHIQQQNKFNRAEATSAQESLSQMSTFILMQDPSFLRFILFCSHVGIIKSAQTFLRYFFQNVFIVIRPGSRQLQNGTVQHLLELPKVDVEKINKYLEQQRLKKEANEAQQKLNQLHSSSPSKALINNAYVIGQNMTVNSKQILQNHHPAFKNKSINRYNGKMGENRNQGSTLSLNSYKSNSVLDIQVQRQQHIQKPFTMQQHFNSIQSSIKTDLPETGAISTIKIFHEPFTHHDNSRIQKCFKIYNEFITLTFKKKIITGQNKDSQVVDFTKDEQNRILKLAHHMGIKNLPKKQSILRSPLLDCFKNHRMLAKIKEQMVRFVHRILNEENGISSKVNKCIIIGQGFTLDCKNANKGGPTAENTNDSKETMPNEDLVMNQKQQIYRYQVGYGNNHQLIKNLMKQRWWWHHIYQKEGTSKLDFDEAQIMWTQWCKGRMYEHLVSNKNFQNTFKDLLYTINHDHSLNLDITGKEENFKDTKLSKAERFQDKMKLYCQSTSPVRAEIKDRRKKLSSVQKKKFREEQSPIKIVEMQGPEQQLSIERTEKEDKPYVSEEPDTNMNPDEENYSEFEQNKDDSVVEKNLTIVTFAARQEQNKNIKAQIEQCRKQMQKIYNRLEFNQHLNNKKALFINMRNYYTYCCEKEDVFDTLPLTFHIKTGTSDPQYSKYQQYYESERIACAQDKARKNIWIIKPGENSNRGNGIKVENEFSKIQQLVAQYCNPNQGRSCILQKYIDNPLLYQRRKFDIRCFSLVTCHNGVMKAYFYRDGYIRTSSKEFSLHNLSNKFVHLVNDAVQKYSEDYGKFEQANKLSYQDYQKYLTLNFPEKNIHVERDIIVQVKKIVTDSIRATFHLLDQNKRINSYELFGYDFMFDTKFKPYLIEVNSNPSLECSSTLLTKLFTQMLDNTFRIAVDPLFPPSSEGFSMKKSATGIELCPENRFDLIFDERIDGQGLLQKLAQIDQYGREEVEKINDLEGSEDEGEPDEAVNDTQQDEANPPELEIAETDPPVETEKEEEA